MFQVTFHSVQDVAYFVKMVGVEAFQNIGHHVVGCSEETLENIRKFRTIMAQLKSGTRRVTIQEFNDGNNVWECWFDAKIGINMDVPETLAETRYVHTMAKVHPTLREIDKTSTVRTERYKSALSYLFFELELISDVCDILSDDNLEELLK